MSPFQVVAFLTFLYFTYYYGYRLPINYLKARKTGFPIYISPVDQSNPLWIIPSAFLLPLLERILPYSFWRILDLSTYGYEWRDYVAGRQRPSAYVLCSPSSVLDIMVQDPDIVNAILNRRKDFPQDPISQQFLSVVGDNLLSSEGDDWSRQRRLIAPLLNERIMVTVWQEGVEQAADMAESFLAEDKGITRRTVEGLSRIAFNVLQRIGYGIHERWDQPELSPPQGHKLIYSDAIRELVNGFILIAIVRSSRILKLGIMPEAVKRKGYALDDFVSYTQAMLAKERQSGLDADQPRTNMLSLMAQIVEKAAKAKLAGAPADDRQTMSDSEIQGNLYQFTLAGFDTTANTLAYSVVMLAIEPRWQDWIAEEITRVSQQAGPTAGYTDILPQLPRTLALMYETLRRFTPVAHIVRDCPREQVLSINGKTVCLPAGSRTTVIYQGLHENESIWGKDQAEYIPSRWITSTSEEAAAPSSGATAQLPSLRQPPKGAFLPWSTGPRICPGMKMAQVEFLAVIYTLFKDYRVQATVLDGETPQQARNRLRNVMLNSSPKLTLQMNKPRDALLTWTKCS